MKKLVLAVMLCCTFVAVSNADIDTNVRNGGQENTCTGSICTNGNGNTFGGIINIGGGNTVSVSETKNDKKEEDKKSNWFGFFEFLAEICNIFG